MVVRNDRTPDHSLNRGAMSVEDSQHTFSHNDSVAPSSALRLSFRPTTTLISSTRRFAGDVLGSVLRDPDSTSRIALAIHELLENTLKYSTDGQALLNVTRSEEHTSELQSQSNL